MLKRLLFAARLYLMGAIARRIGVSGFREQGKSLIVMLASFLVVPVDGGAQYFCYFASCS